MTIALQSRPSPVYLFLCVVIAGVGSKVTQGTRCRESAAGTTGITCCWLINKIDMM